MPKLATAQLETELRDCLLKSRDGDQNAYHFFLQRISVLLRVYFRKSLNTSNVDSAEDLLQETLISIHNKKHLYDDKQKVLPWVYAIAKYRLIDAYRKKSVRPNLEHSEESFENFFVAGADPQSQLEANESLSSEMEGMLGTLTEQQRKILKLAKVEDKSITEIAAQTGLTSSAVKVTIHRALGALRKQFQVHKKKL